MSGEQLSGKYRRLLQDLAEAYAAPVCADGWIERLTDEIAVLREIVGRTHRVDEQTGEMLPDA